MYTESNIESSSITSSANQQIIQKISTLQEPEIKFASKPSLPFNQLNIKSEFSLNDLKKTQALNSISEDTNIISTSVPVLNKEITIEDVKQAIVAYADLKEKSGARQLSITLTTAQLTFENNIIKLGINNETQREQLQNAKQVFLDELRKQLQNNLVGLEIELLQNQAETKAYKPKDVFKAMAEKNPALLELKKRFDLEIDY